MSEEWRKREEDDKLYRQAQEAKAQKEFEERETIAAKERQRRDKEQEEARQYHLQELERQREEAKNKAEEQRASNKKKGSGPDLQSTKTAATKAKATGFNAVVGLAAAAATYLYLANQEYALPTPIIAALIVGILASKIWKVTAVVLAVAGTAILLFWSQVDDRGAFDKNPQQQTTKEIPDVAESHLAQGSHKESSPRIFRDCPDCPDMVTVPAGRFLMGSSDADIKQLLRVHPRAEKAFLAETPQHEVTIPRAFSVSQTHITRKQFADFVAATGYAPNNGCSSFSGSPDRINPEPDPNANWQSPGPDPQDDHPVVCISWFDAQAYSAWLARHTNAEYRLLSEAEAEYVIRGTTTATRQPLYFFGNSSDDLCKYGNVSDITLKSMFRGGSTMDTRYFAQCNDGFAAWSPVGTFPANPFGLKDAHGNVHTWTQDCYASNYGAAVAPMDLKNCGRVIRGGSWFDPPVFLRSANRFWALPDRRYEHIGFRVARALGAGQ